MPRSRHAALTKVPTVKGPTRLPSDEPRIHRKVRSLLNKLSRRNFDSISLQLLSLMNCPWAMDTSDIDQYRRTLAFIGQSILKQAMDDDRFSDVYARFSHALMEKITRKVRDQGSSGGKVAGTTIKGGLLFRNLVASLCQSKFEEGTGIGKASATQANAAAHKDNNAKGEAAKQNLLKEMHSVMDVGEFYSSQITRLRRLGLVKFIGRLYNYQMLSEGVAHVCIKTLLNKFNDAELESVCVLLSMSGKTLDNHRGRKFMDEVFGRMKDVFGGISISPRIRFMLQDIIELRERQWTPRHSAVPPTATAQVRSVTDNGVDKLSLSHPKTSKLLPDTSATINILPPEILAFIFEAGTPTWPKFQDPYLWQLRISSVSRHWRRLAIDTPQIWAKIYIDSLDLKTYETYKLEASFKEHIFPHINRWRRLSICAAHENSASRIFSYLRDAQASVLRDLEIRVGNLYRSRLHTFEHSMHHKIMSGGTPSLHSVRISGHCLHCSKFAQRLTTLVIGSESDTVWNTTFPDLREVFAASPALKNLTIHQLNIDFSEDNIFSLIEIPTLSSLTMDFETGDGNLSSNVQFFSHLSLPALERLEILRISETEFLALLRQSQANYTTIQSLTLAHCETNCQTLSDLLKLFPALKSLRIIGSVDPFDLPDTVSTLTIKSDSMVWANKLMLDLELRKGKGMDFKTLSLVICDSMDQEGQPASLVLEPYCHVSERDFNDQAFHFTGWDEQRPHCRQYESSDFYDSDYDRGYRTDPPWPWDSDYTAESDFD